LKAYVTFTSQSNEGKASGSRGNKPECINAMNADLSKKTVGKWSGKHSPKGRAVTADNSEEIKKSRKSKWRMVGKGREQDASEVV
jgi:hypothetical protein